ncbi:GroES-like protein [Xylaria bambusicola]|uniref:GroES-like protein n=1 Tax=Xylaria bambusicola TaxID=326684 RepID=UPI002007DF07|nr:GroES-like protein [Xylaria bambusicola]KAI0509266.1 GroES-like protein [Xylaria bambusicola]
MAPSAATDEIAPMQSTILGKGAQMIYASVLHGPRDVRLETRTVEPPSEGELQIAVRSTGICGSDVSYYNKFANGDLCACEPLSLGHESSGTVVAIGPNVKSSFKIGDRVALEVGVPCGHCSICRDGKYNLCKKMRFRSSAKSVPHFQGTLQERINHPAIWCHRLPDHISFEAAALLEPLSVAIRAVSRANPPPGSTALVCGAGTIGLLTAAMARQSGCISVIIADIDAGRVDYAVKHGFATHGFVVPRPLQSSASSTSISSHSTTSTFLESSPGNITSNSYQGQLEHAKRLAADMLSVSRAPTELQNEDEDEGVDFSFECTGKEPCMQTCLYATRPGGKVIMVGMGTPIQIVQLSVAHLKEIDILGVFRYANTYPTGIRLLSTQVQSERNNAPVPVLPSLDEMVTHRFKGLAAAREAFELAGRTSDDNGKLVLKVIIET